METCDICKQPSEHGTRSVVSGTFICARAPCVVEYVAQCIEKYGDRFVRAYEYFKSLDPELRAAHRRAAMKHSESLASPPGA